MQIRRVDPSERAQMKQERPPLFRATMDFLHSMNPTGIGHLEDEYDLEAADISANLHQCETLEDIRTLVYEVFVIWFSEELAASMQHIPLERFEGMLDQLRAERG
jgi:hypothetical protein